MPTIAISKPFDTSPEQLRPLVEEVRHKLHDRYQVDSVWESPSKVVFSKQRVNGEIRIDDNNLHIHIELPLLLGAFKAQIEKQIIAVLEKKLA